MSHTQVSSEYPHTVVHANAAWLDKLIPDYMRALSAPEISAKFVGQPLAEVALAAPHEVRCSVSQCVATCCNVLQRVAACCSVV